VQVRLLPKAGEPGPSIIDTQGSRLLIFDTAWWLLANDTLPKLQAAARTQAAIRSAGSRNIVIAAHHPFRSASAHGGLIPFWKGIGLRYVLARSGALLQDLNSIAYRDLVAMMRNAFALNRPLLFAGGHDHSLQVIASPDSASWPRYSVVVGSASKSSAVGHVEGMRYRDRAPGYMRMVTHRDGRVDLFVIAAPDKTYLRCQETDQAALQTCMREKMAGFRITYAMRLK
jgi:hypothetical protein